MHKNPMETRVAAQLGPSYEYEPQDCRLTYVIQHKYLPDFVDRERKEIVEAKGLFTSADRTKMLAVKAANPEWTIRFMFYNPQRTLTKSSKTTYAAWCEKHGFAWSEAPKPERKAKSRQPKQA